MKLKKSGILMALAGLLSLSAFTASAKIKYNPGDIRVPAYEIKTDGKTISLQMVVNASQLPLHRNQEAVIVPVIKNGGNKAGFEPVYVCGRNRYIYHERNNEMRQYMVKNGKDAGQIVYNASIPFQSWMDKADVSLDIDWEGCANCATGYSRTMPLAGVQLVPATYQEELIYLPSQAEPVKIRNVKGTAFIDFVVGKSQILPDFRNNKKELAKIDASIDQVKNDPDVTINEIAIQGAASPEGSYQFNLKLSQARTEALMSYVRKLYDFPSSVQFKASSIGEDWAGLKSKVESMEIENKAGILAIINSGLTDDQKDLKIKKDYPAQYAYLLKNVYPSLRHSDYEITYTVKRYYDVAEIIKVMRTAPQKLSLSEFYLAAQSMKPGTDEYNEVFETAVRMFPDDPVANFNAASVAIGKNDFNAAERYLGKAPQDNKTRYLRGVMAAKQGYYQQAADIFSQIKGMGEAIDALQAVNAIMAGPSGNLNVIDKREVK